MKVEVLEEKRLKKRKDISEMKSEKKAFKVRKWVEVRREHRGLRRWGLDVRCSIKLCEDSVINPLKMSDCR